MTKSITSPCADSDATAVTADSVAESKSETAGDTTGAAQSEGVGAAVMAPESAVGVAPEFAAAVGANPAAVDSALKAPEAEGSSAATEVSSNEEDDEVESQPLPADHQSAGEVAVAADSAATAVPAESVAESKSEAEVAADDTAAAAQGESIGAGAVKHSTLSLDLAVQRLQQHFAGRLSANTNGTDTE